MTAIHPKISAVSGDVNHGASTKASAIIVCPQMKNSGTYACTHHRRTSGQGRGGTRQTRKERAQDDGQGSDTKVTSVLTAWRSTSNPAPPTVTLLRACHTRATGLSAKQPSPQKVQTFAPRHSHTKKKRTSGELSVKKAMRAASPTTTSSSAAQKYWT